MVVTISDSMLIEKAKELGEKLNISKEELKFSIGWLGTFKKPHGIKKYRLHGESASFDGSNINDEAVKLAEEIDKYDLNDVYNFDDTGLFYRMEPDTTLATKKLAGKKNKERITIELCVNATGTNKLSLFIFGKFASPGCFKNINLQNIGVKYKSNSKSWMTAILFQEWLMFFKAEKLSKNSKRKVLLLIDNAGSHNIERFTLENIKIRFLPSNTTSHLQPLDAGIIACFNRKYRRYFVRHLLAEYEKNVFTSKLDILGAIRFSVKAWNEITPETKLLDKYWDC